MEALVPRKESNKYTVPDSEKYITPYEYYSGLCGQKIKELKDHVLLKYKLVFSTLSMVAKRDIYYETGAYTSF